MRLATNRWLTVSEIGNRLLTAFSKFSFFFWAFIITVAFFTPFFFFNFIFSVFLGPIAIERARIEKSKIFDPKFTFTCTLKENP
jgi:hypothetical protein